MHREGTTHRPAGGFTKYIKGYLDKETNVESQEAKKRIRIMVNPNRRGGATKSRK
jgi:hypothetical protein